MKIIRYSAGGKAQYGILEGEVVRGIAGTPYPRLRVTNRRHKLADIRLLAPCAPSKIVALGLNYRSHAAEVKMPTPQEPLIFLKPPTAVIGPDDNIVYPEASQRVDFEGELAVVIKTLTRKIPLGEALAHVLGYTCFNDVTARDLQYRDRQWTRAKGFDTFAAIGPCIETDLDPDNVLLETRLNGELKQHSNTGDLIFHVAQMISFISQVMTLLPGDVIATGTPSGSAPMQPGDTVEVKIEHIGTLRNHVVR